MTRVVDKKARARHARGVDALHALFGWDAGEAATRRAGRRQEQATGPTYEGARTTSRRGRPKGGAGCHPTRHHWSRKGRRQVAKAQRLARRKARS